MAPDIKPFSGPLTAVKINEWLIACDGAFQPQLSDKDKIKQAGQQISSEGVTEDLSEWWQDNDEITNWAEFKEGMKNEALGANWRARALEAFFTTRQEGTSVGDYIKALEANRSVINHGIIEGNKLKQIDDITFKYHMLFNAAPAITAKVMKDNFDIVGNTLKEIQRKILRSAHESANESSTTTKSPASINGYMLLDPWGITGTKFSDIDKLPLRAKDLGPTTKVTIWSNNVSNKYMIQHYQFDFSGSSSVGSTPGHHCYITRDLGMADGEYIASVTITGTNYMYYHTNGANYTSGYTSLSSMVMRTSATPPRTISLAGIPANATKTSSPVETVTFKAPSGWRIVGFHGHHTNYTDYDTSGNSRYPIVGLGAILAPISA